MIIRRSQQTAPIDWPFPDENTVAEMYCNEAYTVDSEAVEDWTSSLQMLLTFAAIFSAVLITLIVDSKTLLEQDNTDVLVDAVVFLMNNLANGTHKPYSPPKFRPSTRSILVNCFFFASLCLSIATALAAVLAMQWVTDYGAVTRRAGSTPEERVKRRHFRYQGGLDWKVDTIIGALPIALHLSVLLFFVGLIVWMWDVHHSVFGVVLVFGALAALFYIITTILAVFCPSCPYRTPLASWIYFIIHLTMTILSRFYRLNPHETGLDSRVEKGAATSNRHGSRLPQWAARLHSRFSQLSLSSRDDLHIQSPDKELMRNSLIWLSNHISISSAVYKRLLVLVNGFASVIDESGGPSNWVNVPWNKIMHVLGTIYTSFVQNLDLDEEAFTEFARETQCLRQSGMQEITGFKLFNGDIEVEGLDFPARLLYTWTTSLSLHDSDVLRKQRFSDEVTIQNSIGLITSTPHELLKIWYELLSGDVQACERILPNLLSKITPSRREGLDQRLDVLLYLISVGELPWASTVPVPVQGSIKYIPSNPLIRRLRIIDWLDSLNQYPQNEEIIRQMRHIATETGQRTLLARYKLTDAEEAELKRMGCINVDRWKRPEPRLHSALVTFDQMLSSAGNQMSKSKRIMLDAMVEIIAIDLDDCKFLFDPKYFSEEEPWMLLELQSLSSSILSAIACATLGIEWKEGEEGSLQLSEEGSSLGDRSLRRLAEVCFVDPPFINGDCTGLWLLRFQLWTHITLASAPAIYLQKLVIDLDSLKRVEEEIQSTRLGITHAGDFILALYHFHYSYEWGNSNDRSLTLIPDIVVGNETSVDSTIASKECIDYLASICHDIRDEPARLIRLLIELLQADINYKPRFRRPSNLLSLLKHALAHLASKELRSFAPSCSRLIEYIRESHGQFEDSWDDVIGRDYMRNDPRPHYERVDRSELKTVCDEVIALLEPKGAWDGEKVDVSWPKYLLRPKGREWIPLDEEVDDHQLYSNNLFVDTSPEVIREAVVRSETSVEEETE